MRHTSTVRSFVLAIILVLSLGLASNVNATGKERPDAQDEGFIAASDSGITVAATREWTVEEMQNAKPMTPPLTTDMTTLPGVTTTSPEVSTDLPMPDGPAGNIPGTLPTDLSADNVGLFASGEVSSYSSYPYSAVGKIFFRQGGNNFVCSGAVIKGDEIWTAGHCVHAGNGSQSGWSSNVVFVPQYRNGSAPCGQWNVVDLVTSTAWFNSGDFAQDFAKGRVSNPNTGCTGTLGFAFNQSYSQNFLAVGYPAAPPYTGERMIFCSNPLKRTYSGSPATYSIDCPMKQGSSGGPYIIRGDELNGNVSYGLPFFPNEVFSPYFGSGAKSLYDYTF